MVLAQPLRVGGLALACALATAILALVTFLASNLVLSVIGGIGLGPAAGPAAETPATAVLLSSEARPTDERAEERCRSLAKRQVDGPGEQLDRCDGRRPGAGRARP